MDDNLETEVKFHAADPNGLRDRLAAEGAEYLGRVFESNTIWDTAKNDIEAGGGLLRLRCDGDVRLTVKLPPEKSDVEFKVCREWEVTVSDFASTEAILSALNFLPKRRYEKERETWLLNGVHVTLDKMPFGWFAELEGRRDDIPALATSLGFSWERRILLNYMKMFAIIKEGEGLAATDPTFAQFDGVTVPIEKYLPRFEAGR